jgi:LmbE family N-acetylglucosaminyl deacetylase/SAM-dependent methyltransferase
VSPSFDSHQAGTDECEWTRSWPSALPSIAAPTGGDRLLVVVAHPDDETLGAGGLIATASALGLPVTVLIASDGEASHPQSLTHSPQQLAQIRRREAADALARLHPQAELLFLGLPDSDLDSHGRQLTGHIADHLDAATHLITPWSGDRHPDHAACARAAAAIARRAGIAHWQFPIWAWHWAAPESPELPRARMRRLPLDPVARATKERAIEAHASQHQPLSAARGDEAVLSPSMLAHFRRDYEVFIVDQPSAADGSYFDTLYADQLDPWGLDERFYERRKRDLILATLPRPRFRRVFEPGCATGLLTTELAPRAGEVVAWDGAQVAVEQATARLGQRTDIGRVVVEQRRIPVDWPAGTFDLIVLSEVGYYCPDPDQLQQRIAASLAPDGVLLACHWRHRADDHPVTADDVHRAIGSGLVRIVAHEEADFLLDVWTRDGRSVATAEGIVS